MNLLKPVLGRWYEVTAVRTVAEIIFIILPLAFFIRTVGFGLYVVPSESMETTLLVGERFLANKFSYWFRKPVHGEIIAFNDPRYHYSANPLVNWFQRYADFNVSNWTKRVIGCPHDHIEGKVENGHPVVYRNGKKLDESAYVNTYPIILVRTEVHARGEGSFSRERNAILRSFDPSVPWLEQPFYRINQNLIVKNPSTLEPVIREPGTPLPGGYDLFDRVLGDDEYWVMGDNRLGSGDSREWGPLHARLIHGKISFRLWSMDTTESYWILDLLKNPLGFWKKVRWGRCFQPVY